MAGRRVDARVGVGRRGRVAEDLEHLDVVGRHRGRVERLTQQQLDVPGSQEAGGAAGARIDHPALLDELEVVDHRKLTGARIEPREVGGLARRRVDGREAPCPRRVGRQGILEELVGVEDELLLRLDHGPRVPPERVRARLQEDGVVAVGLEPGIAAVLCVGQGRREDDLVAVAGVGAGRAREVGISGRPVDVADLQPLEEVLLLGHRFREPERQDPVAGDFVLAALEKLDHTQP